MKRSSLVLAILFALFPLLALCGCKDNTLDKVSKDMDNYIIDMSFDPASMTVSAIQTFEYTHRHSHEISDLKFNLFANVYSADASVSPVPAEEKLVAYPNGYSYGGINIDKITVGDQDVPFIIEDGIILSVPIENGLHQGESVTLCMTYTIKLANILHRLGYGANTVNLGNFFPILCHFDNNQFRCDGYWAIGDPFVSACANYEVSVSLPEGYTVSSTAPMSKQSNSDIVTYSGSARAVRDFAVVLSNKYNTISTAQGDTNVTYYYYDDQNAQEVLQIGTDALRFFSRLMCAYPYESLSIAQSDFCYGGMEYPCLIMVSGQCEREEYLLAVVHEIAHQWAYGLVGNDQINDAFMDEGLAEYLTYRFFSEYDNYGISGQEMMNRTYSSFVTYLDIMKGHASTVDTALHPIFDYNSWRPYAYTTYVKGCIMFYELEKLMGRKNFDKGLASYVEANKYSMATRQSLYDHFGKAHGCAINEWFCSLLEGKDQFLSSHG